MPTNKETDVMPTFAKGKTFGNAPRRFAYINPKNKDKKGEDKPEKPTIIPGQTSKRCPCCKGVRERRFERSGPMTRVECEYQRDHVDEKIYGMKLPFRDPRRSGADKFWNVWLLRKFISPTADSPWYFCWEIAYCKKCNTHVLVLENCYYRQFGPARTNTPKPPENNRKPKSK